MNSAPSPLISIHNRRLVIASLIIVTCLKILCMPAYRSTDFDVHRNWKALTRHLPIQQWYFDTIQNTTVHTLDYPPAFSYFEYFWSNNVVTNWLLRHQILNERCLALLPDSDNDVNMPCVVFMRTSVILSDFVLWWGAWFATTSIVSGGDKTQVRTFLMIVLNPGLLWLDHVHFQYNGMLLGILLTSIGYLAKPTRTLDVTMAAVLYTILICMKHLYICLAPLYLVYLLRHYCFHAENRRFSILRFIYLAVLVVSVVLVVFLPFLELHQLQQILVRLFPFGRGLCHDYPAANVWSLYMVDNKVLSFLGRKILKMNISLPDVTPLPTALLLLASLLPGLYAVWMALNKNSKQTLVLAVVYCSFCTFMLSFHVHEKAIMTALIPLTLLAFETVELAQLFLQSTALGLLGLFPLLFRVEELALKVFSYVGYMSMVRYMLETYHGVPLTRTTVNRFGVVVLGGTALFLEVLHPLFMYPWMEALPLLVTSLVCAIGLIGCWIQSGRHLWQTAIATTEEGKVRQAGIAPY